MADSDQTHSTATPSQTTATVTETPAASEKPLFQLEKFEYLVNAEDKEAAAQQLIFLLQQLDNNYGQWGDAVTAYTPGKANEEVNSYVCTRLAGAITTLFSRRDFSVSHDGFVRLMAYHRWLALIFAVSGYGHADHIIRNINAAGGGVIDPLTLNDHNLFLFCLSYYPDSEIALQPDALWQYDKQTVVRLFFTLLSGRALPTPAAHKKREQLLAWLPEKLKELDSLSFLPTEVLHDVYMHCSYADLPAKHQIKHSINTLIRRTLLAQGYKDTDNTVASLQALERDKPVVLVVLEWFTSQHSVYRTHSVSFRALREHYQLYAVALENAVDDTSIAVFDHCYCYKNAEAFLKTLELVDKLKPDMIYYAGIGMFPYTLYLSGLRLAPVQLVGLGHGASTFCDQMDGFVVEEDFVGDEACFSEPVIKVDTDAMPFVPTGNPPVQELRESFAARQQRELSQHNRILPVRVAACASIMKINPQFLHALAEATRRSRTPIQFCLYMGFAHGLTFDYLKREIESIVPGVEVNAHLPILPYQTALKSCEFFISPFPYGNMNGIVDTVRAGLPGVCLSGGEIHSHIDEGLFRRMELPPELITHSIEEYINAIVRLAEDTDYRQALQRQLVQSDKTQTLFSGKPEKFAQTVYDFMCQKNAASQQNTLHQ